MRTGKWTKKQEQTLSEFIVVFMVVFLLVNALPDEHDRKRLHAWFIMFCSVRMTLNFLLVLTSELAADDLLAP